MTDRGGDHHEKSRSGRQRGGKPARGDQCDHPVGQSRDLGIGQDHDVAVDVELVAGTFDLTVLQQTFTVLATSLFIDEDRLLATKAAPGPCWMTPSSLRSRQAIRPVSSQVETHFGASE